MARGSPSLPLQLASSFVSRLKFFAAFGQTSGRPEMRGCRKNRVVLLAEANATSVRKTCNTLDVGLGSFGGLTSCKVAAILAHEVASLPGLRICLTRVIIR
jgi:hypothetical protein